MIDSAPPEPAPHPLSNVWEQLARDEPGAPPRSPLSWETASVGQRLGPVRYVVDEAAVRSYAGVFGRSECLYPTVPARHTALLRDAAHVIDGGGINARTELELILPPRVGDVITVTGRVVDKYTRRGKPYLVLLAEARNQEGQLIDRVRLTEMHVMEEVARKWEFLRARET